MSSLAVQECYRLPVDPRPLLVPTELEVAPGERYDFIATGKWKDSWLTCGPNGWWGWFLQAWNRLPHQRFFLLCGTAGEDDDHAFPIGVQREWTVPAAVGGLTDRRLFLFANDWPSRYHNNHALPPEKGGPLMVTITRLA